jgi:ABC-2 type transport system permease protein
MVKSGIQRISVLNQSKTRALIILAARHFLSRYQNDKLNLFWVILEPLTISWLYWFLITQVSQASLGVEPYFLFLLSGILPWLWFSKSLEQSQKTFRQDSQLMSSLGISRKLWAVPSVFSRLIDFLLGCFILIPWLGILIGFNLSFLLLAPVAVLQFLLTIGLLYLLSPLTTLIPDLSRVVNLFLRISFFIAPILYVYKDLASFIGPWIAFHPFAAILELYRYVLFSIPMTDGVILASMLSTAACTVLGLGVSKLLEKKTLKALL